MFLLAIVIATLAVGVVPAGAQNETNIKIIQCYICKAICKPGDSGELTDCAGSCRTETMKMPGNY